ncbi:unnamed protein product [Adineta steineri]|uniref:Uncharacterized protein n=1 Tax=Adineta steineri TaxID=433720 RepID=A0A814V671_9BILA|nr:unnamed protein product [Adineta steineri]CAF1182521.1 unnamed protein product [Adineta steineri]
MNRPTTAMSSARKSNVNDDEDADELFYKTSLLLGKSAKPPEKSERARTAVSRSKSAFVPNIIRCIIIPSTLTITNIHIGDKLTTFQMIPKWFEPDDREEAIKDIVYPNNVSDKEPYETVARFRAATDKSTNFYQQPLDVGEQSTETLILSLNAFAKQFGGELSFTDKNLSFEDSTEQMACGIANMGSVHLLATDSLPTAIFNFNVSFDYNRDLARSPDTMANFIFNFSTAIANVLGCQNDYVRVFSVRKSKNDAGTSVVKCGLTIPDPNETKRLAHDLQGMLQYGLRGDKVLRYIKPARYDYKWQSVLSYLQLKPSDFDPRYNLDYAKAGMPRQQMRGNEPYFLPLDWYRHGLNVTDKYGSDNVWLGATNAAGEWPVAFHGTNSGAVSSITQNGLSVGAAKRDLMQEEAVQQLGAAAEGTGLYLATYCNNGSYPQYTAPFTVTTGDITETFCVVFQCRVRPNSYSIHTRCVIEGNAWRVIDPTAIRPYGLLLKKHEENK